MIMEGAPDPMAGVRQRAGGMTSQQQMSAPQQAAAAGQQQQGSLTQTQLHPPLKYLDFIRRIAGFLWVLTLWFWTIPYRAFRWIAPDFIMPTLLSVERTVLSYVFPVLAFIENTAYYGLRKVDELVRQSIRRLGTEPAG